MGIHAKVVLVLNRLLNAILSDDRDGKSVNELSGLFEYRRPARRIERCIVNVFNQTRDAFHHNVYFVDRRAIGVQIEVLSNLRHANARSATRHRIAAIQIFLFLVPGGGDCLHEKRLEEFHRIAGQKLWQAGRWCTRSEQIRLSTHTFPHDVLLRNCTQTRRS
jgi:hypothetical protein